MIIALRFGARLGTAALPGYSVVEHCAECEENFDFLKLRQPCCKTSLKQPVLVASSDEHRWGAVGTRARQ